MKTLNLKLLQILFVSIFATLVAGVGYAQTSGPNGDTIDTDEIDSSTSCSAAGFDGLNNTVSVTSSGGYVLATVDDPNDPDPTVTLDYTTITANDYDCPEPDINIEVVKTNGSSTYVPGAGNTATYTITITNTGTTMASGIEFTDTLPTGVSLDTSGAGWTCTPGANSNCGTNSSPAAPISATGMSVAGGETITISVPVILP